MVLKSNTVRIIGGRWRRQHISIPDIPEVRPTPDRIRETLFNWLMPYVQGATCLDLFAGSGVLGFEALSRGAKRVSFVDKNIKVINQIKETAKKFEILPENVEIIQGNWHEEKLELTFYPYDIIFLDPPFRNTEFPELITWLEFNAYLAKAVLLYVEKKKQQEPITFSGWHCLKEGHTKRIDYFLFQQRYEL